LLFLLFYSRPAVTNRKKQKRQTRQKQGFYFSGVPKTLKKVPPKKRYRQKAPKNDDAFFRGEKKSNICAAEGVFFRSAGPRRGVGGRSDLRFLSVCDLHKKMLLFMIANSRKTQIFVFGRDPPRRQLANAFHSTTQIHKNAFHPCMGSVEKCFLLKGLFHF
jgi:hypothetical protein